MVPLSSVKLLMPQAMIREEIIEKILSDYSTALRQTDPNTAVLFDANSAPPFTALGTHIGNLKDNNVKMKLTRLIRYLRSDNKVSCQLSVT